MSQLTIALDAGHGGSDSGAVYQGRREKDDTLRLTRAVGRILEDNGINVVYTRTTDEYETPFKKATDANNAGADLFVSIHRNSSETDNQYSGVETLVYNDDGVKAVMARNINAELARTGYRNLGVDERPNLVVLKRTKMPAVLVEVGFINNDDDNATFDNNFNAIAQGIANGILKTIRENPNYVNKTDITSEEEVEESVETDTPVADKEEDSNNYYADYTENSDDSNYAAYIYYNNFSRQYDAYRESEDSQDVADVADANDVNPLLAYPDETEASAPASATSNSSNVSDSPVTMMTEDPQEPLYRVQVGAYRQRDNADRMLNSLLMEGFPAFILSQDGYYKVQVGAFRYLTNAIKMERKLRRFHYSTYIVYS